MRHDSGIARVLLVPSIVALLGCEQPPEFRTAHALARYYSDLPIPGDARVVEFEDNFLDSAGAYNGSGLGALRIELQLSDKQFAQIWSLAEARGFRSIPAAESNVAFVNFVYAGTKGLFRITDKARMTKFQLIVVDSAKKTIGVRVAGDI